MKRRGVLALLGGAAMSPPFAARAADQPAKVFRLGVLVVLPRGPGYGAFKERLHQLGYEERRNLRIDLIDWSQLLGGDTARLPEMAAELVGRGGLAVHDQSSFIS